MVVFLVYYELVCYIVFISCPSLRTCSENLDLPSAYLKSSLCLLNLVLKFLLVLPILHLLQLVHANLETPFLSYLLYCSILFKITLFSLLFAVII